MNDIIKFNYSLLPTNFQQEDIEYLEHCATDIEVGGRIAIEGIMRIGKRLNDARAKFGENDKAFGQWRKGRLPWLEYQTALNFMRVHSKFGDENLLYNNYRVENLAPTILYALAAPSTPDAVVEKAIEKAESGDTVTVADVKNWKAELDAEKQRSMEWKDQWKTERDKANQLQAELDITKAVLNEATKPERVEVIPEDYQTAKTRLATLETELTTLKKKQSELVNEQVKVKLRERENELAEMERRKTIMEEQVERMKTYMASMDSDIKRAEVHQKVIEEQRLHLISLAAFISDMEPMNAPETKRRWLALADMCMEAANGIRQVFVEYHPDLTMIHGEAA